MSGEILSDDSHEFDDGGQEEVLASDVEESPKKRDRRIFRAALGLVALFALGGAAMVRASPAMAEKVGAILPTALVESQLLGTVDPPDNMWEGCCSTTSADYSISADYSMSGGCCASQGAEMLTSATSGGSCCASEDVSFMTSLSPEEQVAKEVECGLCPSKAAARLEELMASVSISLEAPTDVAGDCPACLEACEADQSCCNACPASLEGDVEETTMAAADEEAVSGIDPESPIQVEVSAEEAATENVGL